MIDNYFYVQLHLHTAETSACGESGGADMARACKEAGYDMIVVTDHFFNANIGIGNFKHKPDIAMPDLTWAEKVDYLFGGYRAAKAEGDRIGLTVLKGWETFTQGPEYLTYGLGEEFLLANPDIAEIPSLEYLNRVHAAGGYVIHAHPYRRAWYIPDFEPDCEHVDGFETYNAGNRDPSCNERAFTTAREHNLIAVAGSDAHAVNEVRGGAMRFRRRLETMDDLISAIRNGEGEIVEQL